MAVTLDEIKEFIESHDLKYHDDQENEMIVLVTGDEDSTYTHFLRARDDGDIFEWQMQILDENNNMLRVKEHPYLRELLVQLLYLNYNTKFGTWEYDPSDGDVRLAIEIPLEDAKMTQKQFDRIAGYMFGTANNDAEGIMEILETGKVSRDDDEEILKAMLALLEGESSSTGIDGI